MNLNNLPRKFKGIAVALSLIFGFILLSGVTVNAQYRDDGNYRRNNRNNGYYNNGNNGLNQRARQQGFADGVRKGLEDAREGHNNPTGTSEYKRATNGYNSYYGNKELYKQAYREGFLRGFNEGQSRYYNNRPYNNGRYGTRRGW